MERRRGSSGAYRFTVRSGSPGLRDPDGYALDGNRNGIAGDDYVLDFVIDRAAPTVGIASIAPNAVTVAFLDDGDMDPSTATDLANYLLLASVRRRNVRRRQ